MKMKLLILGLVVSLLANTIMVTILAAAGGEEIISAILNKDTRMTWNGDEFLLIDTVTNEPVYPIVYKDRTYIPARFIAEKAGVQVDWDDETKTVSFQTQPEVSVNVSDDVSDPVLFHTQPEVSVNVPADISMPFPSNMVETLEVRVVPFKGAVQHLEGKIAIVTDTIDYDAENYYSAHMAVAKYGG